MRVDIKQIDLAILKVFHENRVGKGEGLAMEALLDSWAATQLREKDLYTGLSHLSSLGYIETGRQGSGSLVTLTESGFSKITKQRILLKEMTNLMTGRYLSSLLKKFVTGSKPPNAACRKTDSMVLE